MKREYAMPLKLFKASIYNSNTENVLYFRVEKNLPFPLGNKLNWYQRKHEMYQQNFSLLLEITNILTVVFMELRQYNIFSEENRRNSQFRSTIHLLLV